MPGPVPASWLPQPTHGGTFVPARGPPACSLPPLGLAQLFPAREGCTVRVRARVETRTRKAPLDGHIAGQREERELGLASYTGGLENLRSGWSLRSMLKRCRSSNNGISRRERMRGRTFGALRHHSRDSSLRRKSRRASKDCAPFNLIHLYLELQDVLVLPAHLPQVRLHPYPSLLHSRRFLLKVMVEFGP